jgi:transcriptional regulator with GAF, ATPase, and Fis domain
LDPVRLLACRRLGAEVEIDGSVVVYDHFVLVAHVVVAGVRLPGLQLGAGLRVLQEKTFNRVGGTRTITSYFRLIAATNRDLAGEVVKGRFREDLYYRLNVVPIILPPLRERGEDAVLLAKHFIERYAKKYNRTVFQLSPEDEKRAKEYTWPGNVRELKNIVERAMILSHENRLDLNLSDLHPPVQSDPFSDKPTLDEIQRRYIKYIIESTGGKISGPGGAAEVLGLKRTSLYSRMKALKSKR